MQCPDCGKPLETATAVKRHVPPAHGWSLTDSRQQYLDNKFTTYDGQHVTLITWNEQDGGTEAIKGNPPTRTPVKRPDRYERRNMDYSMAGR